MFKKFFGFANASKLSDASLASDTESLEPDAGAVGVDTISESSESKSEPFFYETVVAGLWESIPINVNDAGFAAFMHCWGAILSDVFETQELEELALRSDGYEDLYRRLKASDKWDEAVSVPSEIDFLAYMLVATCIYQSCLETLEAHMEVLVSKRRQLIRLDEFGDEIDDDWFAYESKYFSTKLEEFVHNWLGDHSSLIDDLFPLVVCGHLEELSPGAYRSMRRHDKLRLEHAFIHRVRILINTVILWAQLEREEAEGLAATLPFTGDGHEYEHHLLRRMQTETPARAEVTRGSGDQGADLIVYFNDETYVVQAKHYTSAVGNKAVQEAHSAKSYYSADHAIVVTNAGFTRSAMDLAMRTGVRCWNEVEFVSFFSCGELVEEDTARGQLKKQQEDANILGVISSLFEPALVSVESVYFDKSQVKTIRVQLDDSDLILFMGENLEGSMPGREELEYCLALSAQDDEPIVVQVVPDRMDSDLYDAYEEEFGENLTFFTVETTVDLLNRLSR